MAWPPPKACPTLSLKPTALQVQYDDGDRETVALDGKKIAFEWLPDDDKPPPDCAVALAELAEAERRAVMAAAAAGAPPGAAAGAVADERSGGPIDLLKVESVAAPKAAQPLPLASASMPAPAAKAAPAAEVALPAVAAPSQSAVPADMEAGGGGEAAVVQPPRKRGRPRKVLPADGAAASPPTCSAPRPPLPRPGAAPLAVPLQQHGMLQYNFPIEPICGSPPAIPLDALQGLLSRFGTSAPPTTTFTATAAATAS